MSEGSNRAAKSLAEVRHGLPDAVRRGNQGKGVFCAETAYFGRKRPEPFAYGLMTLILRA